MNLILNNPYRILGVYANSQAKEIAANQSRIKAFIKVGKTTEFPLDLKEILPATIRTEANIADAVSKLTLPADKVRYAQFWFVKENTFDDIAFNKLQSGDMEGAIDVWSKKDNVSSLQNRVVCAIIKEDIGSAITCAEALYSNPAYNFLGTIGITTISSDSLPYNFLDMLCEEMSATKILPYITLPEWKKYVADKSVKPLIDEILSAIEDAKKARRQGADESLRAGTNLMKCTKTKLSQLKQLLSVDDIQYQMMADKLALEILQCGIDYYNDSDDDDSAYKAKPLQDYANKIAVGETAKDRCRENVEILERIISELPPKEVVKEDRAIKEALRKFNGQPVEIEYSVELIKNCAPHLVSIKTKLGKINAYYLRISDKVCNTALYNLIEDVNNAQKNGDVEELIEILTKAWKATLYLDKLDMSDDYKRNRYNGCRQTLYELIDHLKGFEPSCRSSLYRYCGWANGIDVSDLDMRTEDEVYAACNSISSLRAYIARFPKGRFLTAAKSRLADLKKKEQDKRDQKKKKEQERKEMALRYEREIKRCTTLSEVISLYKREKATISSTMCGEKALSLCSCKKDYVLVRDVFSDNYSIRSKAQEQIDKIENEDMPLIVSIIIIHSIWGLFGIKDGFVGFIGGAFAGIAGWLIPINYLAKCILDWIYKQMRN